MPETATTPTSPTTPVYRPQRPRSFAGPIVLIIIGVVFLLGNMKVIGWRALAHWYAQYWPVLIIVWGLIKLIEYYADRSAGRPTRGVGAGGVVLLIFLVLTGLSFTGAARVNWNALDDNLGADNGFFTLFGNTYDFQQELQQEFPANALLRLDSQRGDITINAWEQPQIKVVVHKRVVADNEMEAKRVDDATRPVITVGSGTVTLDSNTMGSGNRPVREDLEIWVPRKAALDLSVRRGDVAVHSRQGDVKLSMTSNGDVTFDDVAGNATLTMRRGDLNVSNVTGDLNVDGRGDDIRVAQVGGAVHLTGEFFGDIDLSRIGKSVSFKSSRTDLELAKLEGDLRIESEDMRGNALVGPLRLQTRSKNIHLEDVSGAIKLENSNQPIEIHVSKLPLAPIEISNRNASVQVTVPSRAAFQVEATSVRGDVETDFPDVKIDTSSRAETRATGNVGTGGPKLIINNEHGNIEIRKGT